MPPCYPGGICPYASLLPGGVCTTLSGTRVVYVLHSQVPGWYIHLLLPGWYIHLLLPGWYPVHDTRVGSRSCYPGGYPRVYNGGMVGIPVGTTVGRWVSPLCTPGYTMVGIHPSLYAPSMHPWVYLTVPAVPLRLHRGARGWDDTALGSNLEKPMGERLRRASHSSFLL